MQWLPSDPGAFFIIWVKPVLEDSQSKFGPDTNQKYKYLFLKLLFELWISGLKNTFAQAIALYTLVTSIVSLHP